MSQFYLVAPSGYCINQQAAACGVERLQQAGHEVWPTSRSFPAGSSVSPGLNRSAWPILTSWPSCPGATVSSSRCAAATAPVACCRIIDWQGLIARQQRDPLLICGHSDFTAIQSGLLATGNVITFSGPMLAGNFGAETLDPFTEHHFWQALRQAEFTLEWPGEGPNCQVEGTLWEEIWRC